MTRQLAVMNHVMFGGLTHEPAARLAQLLVDITPAGLETVFFSDSGSVAVEVAVEDGAAVLAQPGPVRQEPPDDVARRLPRRHVHPDERVRPRRRHALAVDRRPVPADLRPAVPSDYEPAYVAAFEAQLREHADDLAAVIVEPVVQGAGGMRFHDPRYLADLRAICDRHDVLLIFDEIATGFGRTGQMFAADHAGVSPDIMCVGKALTGGYVTLAATLCTLQIARTISGSEAGALMHGPTFMANALACAVSVASVELLLGQDWRGRVAEISAGLAEGLEPARALPGVTDVRVCGAIGVIETREPVDLTDGHPGGARQRRVAAAVPQPHLRHAAVHLHPRRDRPDHLGDGRRRPCTNLNGVQVLPEEHPVTRLGLSPLAWLDTVEQQRRQAGLRRSLRARPAVATELDLASNDYLGLSQHPAVIDGGVTALRTWGAGSTGSRLVTGNTELHEQFEADLAEFVGAESGLVFSSGYTANLGAVVALSGPGSLLVSDAFSHASLVDACRLSRARVVVTPHNDVDAVEAALAARDEERALVITDSVFSTDGALAPLRRLHEVCRRHRALLLVDEAHGLGVRGTGGRGLLHEVGLAGAPDVVDDDDHVEVAGQPGRCGARPGRGA